MEDKPLDEEKKERAKSEDVTPEMIFNRQINYFLLRRLYRHIHKYTEKKESTKPGIIANLVNKSSLYETLGIPRNMFTKLTTGKRILITNKRESALHEKTGVSEEIFQGSARIDTPHIDESEWIKYFRGNYGLVYVRGENGEMQGEEPPDEERLAKQFATGFNKRIAELMEKASTGSDKTLLAASFFFETGKSFIDKDFAYQVNLVKARMAEVPLTTEIDFDKEEKHLKEYYDLLTKERQKVGAIINYYEYVVKDEK